MGLPDDMNHWSRIRKLIVILLLGLMMTLAFLWIAETNSEMASKAITPYCTSMAVLGLAYVADSVLRILAERIPLPGFLSRYSDAGK